MPYQSKSNRIVAYKVQSALGTPSSGGSGLGLRVNSGSQGLRMAKAVIPNAEVRRDGMTTRGRHGSRMVSGSYIVNMALGELDTIFEAALRGTWSAAVTRTYDNSAGLTSLAVTSASEITQVGTTSLLGVVYQGDMIKLGNMSTAANNDVWCRVTNVTATVISLAGSPLTVQAADTACTLTVARTLIQANPPTERYFTFEEYDADTDTSLTFTDIKVNRLEISAQPNQNVTVTVGLMGLDATANATGASPVLTSPTLTTSLPMVLADGTIRVNGVDYADLTGFSLSLDLGGSVPAVLGPNAPDVFLNNATLAGSVSGLKTDNDHWTAFDSETQIDFHAHLIEVGDSNPKDFVSLYIGNAVFDGADPDGFGEGELVETIPWRAGKDEAGGDRAATMLKISTSAA